MAKSSNVCALGFEKLSKSAAETREMLHDAFGEHSLSWRMVFECHSRFKAF
jgi:hypothetical protein